MNNSNLDPAFAEAFQKQDELIASQKKAEEEKGKGGNIDFEQMESCGLFVNKEVVFRPLGYPITIAEERKRDFDARIILESEIQKDDTSKGKGTCLINWKSIDGTGKNAGKRIPDPNWILTRLYDAINKSDWIKYTEADVNNTSIIKNAEGQIVSAEKGYNGYYKKVNEGKPSFERIKNNKNNSFPVKFYPATKIAMNVIDRMDDWCETNKHSKLLATSVSSKIYKNDETGEETKVVFSNKFISKSMYDSIIHLYQGLNGTWWRDTIIKRYKDGGGNWTFDLYDSGLKDRTQPETQKIIVDGEQDITNNYEKYNLMEKFPDASYTKLEKNLIGLFRQTDLDLNTNFTQELLVLVEEEKIKNEAEEKKKEGETKTAESPVESPPVENVENKEITETPSVRQERGGAKEKEVSFEDQCKLIFPNWTIIEESPEDKEDLLSAIDNIVDSKIIWKTDRKILECETSGCDCMLPNTIQFCPKCGCKY